MAEVVLRKTVHVAGAGDPAGAPLKRLERGTQLEAIDPSELAQLAPGHFVELTMGDSGPMARPVDLTDHPHVGALAAQAAAEAAEQES